MTLVPYEINHPRPGGLALVGRDPGADEVRLGRPFVGKAGRLLDDCLHEAGILRSEINILNVSRHRPPANKFEAHGRNQLDAEISHLHGTLSKLRPSVVVALGNEACHALVPEWPGDDIKRATGIEERRGYVFDSDLGFPVVATMHPAFVAKSWTPWRVLLSYDLQRAQEIHQRGHLQRPEREVEIVTSARQSRNAVDALRGYERLAVDIETRRDSSLACIGFAGESGQGIVFPEKFASGARKLLESPKLTSIWANGIYDLYVLRHLEGWNIPGGLDDVQLMWHAAYPELAGQKEDKKRNRHTRKSLSFLTSLFTYDPWWKDYDFAPDSHEQYVLNGLDVCTTLDVHTALTSVLDEVGAWNTYEHERSLMWPCVDMLARGLNVNDALRVERRDALEAEVARVAAEANEVVIPLIDRERDRLTEMGVIHLFEETDPTCTCCGHGAKKQMACWSCAGFEKAPTKADMLRKFSVTEKISKTECEERFLPVCHVCCGAPRETRTVVNLNSDTQAKIILYDILRLPKRFKRNTKGESVLTTDEATLKNLLGGING